MARVAIYAAPGLAPSDGPVASTVRELAEKRIAQTIVAQRYGYHATLKAPFRLRDGLTLEGDLVPSIMDFCATHTAALVPSADIHRIGGFWALTPGAPAPALHALADDVVQAFDRFRAEPTEAEIARRNPEHLSARQRELLDRWGYPYVFDEFRFHITLTDELIGEQLHTAGAELHAEFAPHLGADLPISVLALFVEPEPGADFVVHSLHPLISQEAR
jgi:hypothetical protein